MHLGCGAHRRGLLRHCHAHAEQASRHLTCLLATCTSLRWSCTALAHHRWWRICLVAKEGKLRCRQLGIVDFEPLKPYFLDLHIAARAYLPTLPGAQTLEVSLDRDWSADDITKPPTAPALVRQRTAICSSRSSGNWLIIGRDTLIFRSKNECDMTVKVWGRTPLSPNACRIMAEGC